MFVDLCFCIVKPYCGYRGPRRKNTVYWGQIKKITHNGIKGRDDSTGSVIMTREENAGIGITTREENTGNGITNREENTGSGITSREENTGSGITTTEENIGSGITTREENSGITAGEESTAVVSTTAGFTRALLRSRVLFTACTSLKDIATL